MFKKILFTIILGFSFFSCSPNSGDFQTPQLQNIRVIDNKTIEFTFHKPATINKVELEGSDIPASIDGNIVTFEQPLSPGELHHIVVDAGTKSGNTTKFKADFYSHNTNPAEVMFSEFTIRHSAQHRERIELYVTKSGNLAGLTLHVGQPGKSQSRSATLPSFEVKEGDLVTLLMRPLGNESENTFDIFVPIEPPGLPNSRGILIITDRPDSGKIIDALAYVDGVAEQPAAFLIQLNWLQSQEAWIGDPIQVCGASPTRSILRRTKVNSKTKDDWYVTVTGGANFSQDRRPSMLKQTCIR